MQSPFRTLLLLCFSLSAGLWSAKSAQFEVATSEQAPLPITLEGAFVGSIGDQLVVAGGRTPEGSLNPDVYTLRKGQASWAIAGQWDQPLAFGAVAAHGQALLLVGGMENGSASDRVVRLTLPGNTAVFGSLTPLPQPAAYAAAIVDRGRLFVAGGTTNGQADGALASFLSLDLSRPTAQWIVQPEWNGGPRYAASLVLGVESLFLIGGLDQAGEVARVESFHSMYAWREHSAPPTWDAASTAVTLGESHAVALAGLENGQRQSWLYHTISDTWIPLLDSLGPLAPQQRLARYGEGIAFVSADHASIADFSNPRTNYGWWDHLAVIAYFCIMIYVGFYFIRQKSSTEAYFRGGHKIPWWATGMSLFATGASAMSLLSMPGKSYATNWTFFSISIYSVICLPLSMYLLAPLVRKLNFPTAFAYLEDRFGLAVRMFGSGIFVAQQILGRMGPVMLLPAIAMSAITGIDIKTSIIAMGIVTTLYTFLGGLSAVIWTDTIQGLVMIAAVLGCLILVVLRLDMPSAEIWTTLQMQDKLHTFDWSWALTESNVFTILVGVAAITLFGIGDQNYVQRVQCTPTMSDAKKAIATQMAVAVPINILLFALGTALFLFYKQSPADLNPVMKTDGIFPFFAAQQLPPGVSGLVVAALLAATMSTISSSICSVSNLGVDDFYRRFSRKATEGKAVFMGRALTVFVGALGVGAALFLSEFRTPSVWDLALKVISFITSATLGIFFLGLFTRRANQPGVLVGIVAGMLSTYYFQTYTALSFWLFPVTGSIITVAVGYAVSLATGGNTKDIDGLTVYTLKNRKGGADD